jgi:hypothetical protein
MTGLDIARREAVTEAEVDDYIEMHRPPNCSQPQFSRDFWREQAEADQQYRAQVAAKAQAKTTEAAEIEQLRRRVATLEKGLLTEGGWFLKAVGTALGEVHRQVDDRIDMLENREPVPLPVPDWHNPTVRYCGLWNAKNLYGPGDLVTFSGGGWVATSAMGAGVRPGDGETGWRLAVKSDTSMLRTIVRDEVRKQLKERPR